MAEWYDNIDRRGYNNYDGAQEYNPNFGQSFAGVGRFDPRNMIRPDNLTQDLGASTYQAPPPSQLNTLDPNWQNELAGYGSTMDRGNIDRGFLSGITGPVMGGLKWLGEKFKRPEAKQRFYDEVMQGRSVEPWQTGTYKGNQYGLYNSPSGLKVSSDIIGWGEGREKNLDSMFGSKSIEEMEQKKLEWALDRIKRGKSVHSRFRPILEARGMLDRIGDQRPGRTIDTTVTGTTLPGTGGSTPRPDMTIRDFNPREARRAAPGGYSGRGGSGSGPQGGAGYGPWRAEGGRMAQGGRIGYQEGELVEDESMFEATPRGMMEENIEEVQGEPTREQLEAIALEIFQLPLEELNKEQLIVVYQAAMEQEPAEEEVQFAAQEGPGEGIASLV